MVSKDLMPMYPGLRQNNISYITLPPKGWYYWIPISSICLLWRRKNRQIIRFNCMRINQSKKLNYFIYKKGNTLRTQAALMIHDSGHKLKLSNRDMIDKYSVQFIGNWQIMLIGLQLMTKICICTYNLVTLQLNSFFMDYLHYFVCLLYIEKVPFPF